MPGSTAGGVRVSALPTNCGIVPALVAGRAHFWSAAGSEAPRRFGSGARARPEPCVNTGARRKSKAPSPLRSAGALQNLNAGAPNTYQAGRLPLQSWHALLRTGKHAIFRPMRQEILGRRPRLLARRYSALI